MITSSKFHLYVESSEGICGGEPVLAGTRIPVKIVIGWFKRGKEVDKLLKENTIEY